MKTRGETTGGELELEFRAGDVNLAYINPGAIVWKTDDPAIKRRLEHSFSREIVVHRVPVDFAVRARVGARLEVRAEAEGNSARAWGDKPLEAAEKFPITEAVAREQLGRLGDTPFELGRLTLEGDGRAMAPKSVLNDLRRRVCGELIQARQLEYRIVEPDALAQLRAESAVPAIENQSRRAGTKIEIPVRPWHMAKALLITAALVAAFLITPIPREIAALVAAGLVLISRTQDPRKLFALVDWDLILLFIGLFVVIGNVQQHGLLAGVMSDIQARVPLYNPLPFSAVTLVLSNIVSNVPAVLLLMPGLGKPLATAEPVTHTWYLLAVVSTFAGNFTLLGSIANLIVAEQARPLGVKLTFLEYLKTGLPLTLLTTALAIAYFTWLA
jgi:hypothetical protein